MSNRRNSPLLVVIHKGTTADPSFTDQAKGLQAIEHIAEGGGTRGPWRAAQPKRAPFEAALLAAIAAGSLPTFGHNALKGRAGRWSKADGMIIPMAVLKPAQRTRAADGVGLYQLAQSWRQNLVRDLQENGLMVSDDGDGLSVVSFEQGLAPDGSTLCHVVLDGANHRRNVCATHAAETGWQMTSDRALAQCEKC
jgi:hypothetical protein